MFVKSILFVGAGLPFEFCFYFQSKQIEIFKNSLSSVFIPYANPPNDSNTFNLFSNRAKLYLHPVGGELIFVGGILSTEKRKELKSNFLLNG